MDTRPHQASGIEIDIPSFHWIGIVIRRFVFLMVCLTASFHPHAQAEDEAEVDSKAKVGKAVTEQQRHHFETRIRPALIAHCYGCHSAKANEVKGGLRVDSAEALLRGGDSGPAIVPGKPLESLLVDALRYDGLEMPPKKRLPATIIKDFERWVRDGAWDPRAEPNAAPENIVPPSNSAESHASMHRGRSHWAFRPVTRHQTPTVADREWPRSWIDSFVLARMEAAGLQPSPESSTPNLIRRLYFDLIGLPPSPAQLKTAMAAMEQDRETSYQQLVDQLLESPQFGVHWARRWLDVVRYADSNGGDFNATFHNAWRYRDYVVDSMNRDKAIDQFIREQIAGDLMPYADDRQRTEQLVGTGMLMLGTKMLSERDKEKLTLDVADEQIHAVGSAFLGLTLGCARCHDHKFDPIPTEDYYALAGIFLSTRTLHGESQKYVSTWKRVELPAAPSHVTAVKQYKADKKEFEKQIQQLKKQWKDAKETQSLSRDPLLRDDVAGKQTGAWKSSVFKKPFIGPGYVHDNREAKGEKSILFEFQSSLSGEYELQMAYIPHSSHAAKVPIDVKIGDMRTTAFIDQTQKPTVDNHYEPVGRFAFPKGESMQVTVRTTGTEGYVIVDALRLRVIDKDGKPSPFPEAAAASVAKTATAAARVSELESELANAEAALKQLMETAPDPLPEALAASDLEKPQDCEIRIRGEHRNRGPRVPRGFLQVMPGKAEFDEHSSGRLQLANWIADPAHPLTARVYVNRIWSHLLGEGLVRTVDNFGALGELPSHPDLLDELAARFTANDARAQGWNWSTKRLIREIVLSRTYRQSTQHHESAWQVDPDNRLLWRAHRRRLPAESIRDGLLAVSGGLDTSPGGNPVPGLGVLVTNNSADAEQYQGQATKKRSLYLPMIRSELPPTLAIFDLADPDLVVGKRPSTNVPAQALLLMNSPFVMDCADRTAARLMQGDATNEEFVDAAYLAVLSRSPSVMERKRAIGFISPTEASEASEESTESGKRMQRLARFIHVLLATTEYRTLN